MSEQLIATSELHLLDPIGDQSNRAYESIVSVIRANLGDEHALLLSEPDVNNSSNVASWYTQLDGTCKKLSDLPESERLVAESRYQKLRREIENLASQMMEDRSDDTRRIGEAIHDAMIVPDDDSIYVIVSGQDEKIQPVLINWSHRKKDSKFVEDKSPKLTGIVKIESENEEMKLEEEIEDTNLVTNNSGENVNTTEEVTIREIEGTEKVKSKEDDRRETRIVKSPVIYPNSWRLVFSMLWFLFVILMFWLFYLLIQPCGVILGFQFNDCPVKASEIQEAQSQKENLQSYVRGLERDLSKLQNNCKPSDQVQ